MMQYPLLTISALTITQSYTSYSHIRPYRPFPTNHPPGQRGERRRERKIYLFIYFLEREEKACTETGLGDTGALDVQERR